MQDRDVSFNECDSQVGQQSDLFGVLTTAEAQLWGLRKWDGRLGKVREKVMRADRQWKITKSDDGDKLGLAVKFVIDQDALQKFGDIIHPWHDLNLDRVGQVGDQTAGYASSHCIAVLRLEAAEHVLNEILDVWSDPRVNCVNQPLQEK